MWNTIQCAVQGRGHIKDDIPCQDKTYAISENHVHVIALADGAGSATLSHHGAEIVTKNLAMELARNFDIYFSNQDGVEVKQQLINGILESLDTCASMHDCQRKDLASTLLFTAIKDDRFIVGHIGDGVIGYLKNHELNIASQPDNGEFTNTTIFTTSKDAFACMKLMKGELGEIDGFVLMSDGTEASLYNKREKTLAGALRRIMQMSLFLPSQHLETMLQDSFDTIIKEATTDDCSIAIITKRKEDLSAYNNLNHLQKCEMLNLNRNASHKQIQRFDAILSLLQNAQTIEQLARHLYIKPKYVRKYLNHLSMLGYIEKNGAYYKTYCFNR